MQLSEDESSVSVPLLDNDFARAGDALGCGDDRQTKRLTGRAAIMSAAAVTAWAAAWVLKVREMSRKWQKSCHELTPGDCGNRQNKCELEGKMPLHCELGSSCMEMLAMPVATAIALALVACALCFVMEVRLKSFSSIFGSSAHFLAASSAAIVAAGSAVVSIWAPPQHWHQQFNLQSTLVTVIPLVATYFVGNSGFRERTFSLQLCCVFLDSWIFLVLFFLEINITYNGYPRPMIFGTSLLWVYLSWLVTMFLASGLAHRFGRAYLEIPLLAAFYLAGNFPKLLILQWEAAYSGDFFRLIPLVSILSIFLSSTTSFHWLALCRLDKNRTYTERISRTVAPQDMAGFVSRYTFWWVFKTLKYANAQGKLNEEDLPQLPHGDRPSTLFNLFRQEWQKLQGGAISGWRLLYVISYKVQKGTFLSSLLHGWCFLFLMLLDPILLKSLLQESSSPSTNLAYFAGEEGKSIGQSLGLVLVLSLSMFVRVTCMEVCYFESTRVNNNARTVLVTAIFRKTLRGVESPSYTAGALTNMMATDADKIGKTSWMVFFISQWTWAFCSLPVVIYFMHDTIGNAVWVGMATILVGGYAARRLGNIEKPSVRKLQQLRDERSQLMKEILSSISVIKLQGWEDEWRDRIYAARSAEMKQLVIMRLLQAVNILVGALLSVAVPVSIFAWYTAVDGKKLDSKTAFTTLAWISQMNWSINVLPAIYNMYASLSPSCERLATFLLDGSPEKWLAHEVDDNFQPHAPPAGQDPPLQNQNHSDVAISLHGPASLGYLKFEPQVDPSAENSISNRPISFDTVLSGVTVDVKEGELVIIAGPVGSGKSTLLAALAKGMDPLQGSCVVNGTRAFVSQRPFLLNETIRNNILFGSTFESERYNQSIHCAALEQDIQSFQEKDETLVGENGVQLSGGQKARVALARALYSQADVYFFDDVLSAVDASTGQFIWNKTFSGLLKGKTIILVTHQLQYLSRSEVSRVIVLGQGKLTHFGSWKHIERDVHEDISAFVSDEAHRAKENSESKNQQDRDLRSNARDDSCNGAQQSTSKNASMKSSEVLVSIKECEARLRSLLNGFVDCSLDEHLIDEICCTLRGVSDDAKERKREGMIAWQDFKVYLNAFGSNLTILLLGAALIIKAVLDVFMNVWLSIWGDSSSGSLSYLYWYVGLGVSSSFFSAFQSVVLTVCALQASRVIHEKMFESLLGAAMSFFDRTPSGQIMNRFLQDLANIDNFVPNAVMDQITKTLNMLTQVGLVLLFAPWVIFTLPFLFIPYFVIFGTVRCAARDTRRLEAIAHSPVYTQFSDILRGKLAIRAYAVERRFEHWNALLVRSMARGKYSNEAVGKWAQTLTTQNGSFLYLSCGIICVILVRQGSMTLGQFGLVLLYSANLQRASMDYMMGLTNLESQFVSVERVAEFTRTPSEFTATDPKLCNKHGHAPDETPNIPDLKNWPTKGSLEFQAVTLRYALHRPTVLNGLTFKVEHNSKVALCGRTGSGKSSCFGAIGRLYPISRGKILIDGLSIDDLPLQPVRRAVRMISQDSVLVCGSLRRNLAGQDAAISDEDIWSALSKVQMRSFVESQPGMLDFEVEDGGRNLSVGQRQLLCTARALLPRDGILPKILLCDEATANVDLATDRKIHDVLLSLDATVIMISHRLQHVKHFDKVIVISGTGSLEEEGSPSTLLANPSSALSQLFANAGLA